MSGAAPYERWRCAGGGAISVTHQAADFHDMTRLRADLVLLLCAALWGSAFVMQKTAMTSLGPLSFVAARALLACIVLAPLAMWETQRNGAKPLAQYFYKRTAVATLLLFAGSTLQQVGLVTATVINASFLTALYAVFVPFVAWMVFKRPPAPIVWPAALISAFGVWLLGGAGLAALSGGDALVAGSAIFWAMHIVISGLASEFDRPFLFSALQFAGLAALAGIAALAIEAPPPHAFVAAAPEIAYVGIITTALTFTLLTIALRHAPPSEAAIILSSENLFASLAGATFLGERMGLVNASGAVLILVSIIVVQTAAYRRELRVPPK